MAEICSAYPSAGSVYHWAGQLTSVNWSPLAAFICGWFNFLGYFYYMILNIHDIIHRNASGDAGFATAFASLVNGAMVASYGNTFNNGTAEANITPMTVKLLLFLSQFSPYGPF